MNCPKCHGTGRVNYKADIHLGYFEPAMTAVPHIGQCTDCQGTGQAYCCDGAGENYSGEQKAAQMIAATDVKTDEAR